MEYIEFMDKGFEQAVRKVTNPSTEQLTLNDLKKIDGILVDQRNSSELMIPWHADSAAFQMRFPELMFNVDDSENGKWILDLRNFSHIKTLHLYVPTQELYFLSKFESLVELYVKDNETKDWSFIEQLKNLCFLYLRRCDIQDLTPIRTVCTYQNNKPQSEDLLTRLKDARLSHLGLIDCGISDISPLAECKTIEDLNLSHNEISDVKSLEGLFSLYYLTLRYNNLTDISPLGNLIGVYYMNVRHNQISDISALSHLKDKSLRRLFLGDNPIKDYSPSYQLRLVMHDIVGL